MIRILVSCVILITMVSVSFAQVSVGLSPMYTTRNVSFFNKTFENKGMTYEAEASLVAGITLRGYYLCNKEYSTQIDVFNEEEQKKSSIDFKYGFRASRAEIGYPFYFKRCFIEPFFIDSYTVSYNTAKGSKLDYANEIINHTQGLGAFYSYLLYNGNNISIKGFYTLKDNMIDLRYNKFNSKSSR